jgi:hypothetical protein
MQEIDRLSLGNSLDVFSCEDQTFSRSMNSTTTVWREVQFQFQSSSDQLCPQSFQCVRDRRRCGGTIDQGRNSRFRAQQIEKSLSRTISEDQTDAIATTETQML